MKLEVVRPIAIMPGGMPLGRVDPSLEARVRAFCQEHGSLPVLVLLPRELRPGEALSWSAYLATGNGVEVDGPDAPASRGVAGSRAESGGPKRAKIPSGPKSGVGHHHGKNGRPVATTEEVDREIRRLSGEGLGVRAIAEALEREGAHVSPRTAARRLVSE